MTDRLVTGTECDILVSKLLGFETFPFFFMVSVSEILGIEKSIGIGFEKIWYRKKNRYRFQKNFVSEKVSVSVWKFFGIEKKVSVSISKTLVSIKVSVLVSKKFGIRAFFGLFLSILDPKC